MRKKRHLFFIMPFFVFILWQSGCKKNSLYDGEVFADIRGEWTINIQYSGGFTSAIKCTFSGNLNSGTVTPEYGTSGEYVVEGEHNFQIEFRFGLVEDNPQYYDYYVGEFIESNYMKGTGSNFSWRAIREVNTE